MAYHARFCRYQRDGPRLWPGIVARRSGRRLASRGQFQGARHLFCPVPRLSRRGPSARAGEILEEKVMPIPQDIRPVFQDIQDTLVRSEAPWVEQSPMSKVKVLWVGRETGTWASLHHWKKGYVAPRHKHLAGAHAYVLAGKLQVRDDVLNAGDYVYEPSGVLHDQTTALEDTTYLFICNGAVLFFDENGFTGYTNWEVMERLRAQAEATPRAEAAE